MAARRMGKTAEGAMRWMERKRFASAYALTGRDVHKVARGDKVLALFEKETDS
jgi:hypothetical protein